MDASFPAVDPAYPGRHHPKNGPPCTRPCPPPPPLPPRVQVTSKGEGCYLFVCTAPLKSWAKAEPTLRKMVEAFRA